MKKIGIDLDGTLFKTYEKMANRYRSQRGKEFNLDLILDFDCVRNLLDRLWLYQYFHDASNYSALETYPNAIYSLLKLKESYELYFLTTRPPTTTIRNVTVKSIQEIVEVPDEHIIFCENINYKIQIMKEKKISILIEDNPKFNIIPDEIMIIILKRIWNFKIQINDPHIKVVESWNEILKLL